jgi:hypothetical protein
MPTYKIERWDSVISSGNTFPLPMIYIKGDDAFQKYVVDNDYIFRLKITGTNSDYDNNEVVGVINNSANYPNNRINFFNKNEYLTITLFGNWNGYPPKNGEVFIQGNITGPDKIIPEPEQPFKVPEPLPWPDTLENYENKKDNNLNSNQIYLILIGLLLVFAILLIYKLKC